MKSVRPTKGRLWLYGLIIGLLLFLAWRFYFNDKPPKRSMMEGSPPVRVAEAVQQNVPHFLTGLGTVQPSGDVLVQSRVGGQLIALHFKEGQRVEAGDLLAEIDPRPFQASLDQARGSLEKDRAQLENAKRDLARYEKLIKSDYIADQQYQNQRALVRQWEGAVDADRAAVDAAALQLEYSRIMAPITGRLGLKSVDEGNQITANDPVGIVRITETTPCDVLFTLPESQIGLVLDALRKRELDPRLPPLLAQAWDRENKLHLASGELLSLDNQIDNATGTVRLKARFPNTDYALYPNQFVNIRLLVRTIQDAITVPVAAVQLGARGSYCYVAVSEQPDDKQATCLFREITPGIIDGPIQVINDGIQAGDMVVVDGIDRLRNDIQVRIAAIMATPKITIDTPPDLSE